MLESKNICLQCKKVCEGPSNRLVQDSCGHKKCRVCLLEDEEKCKQCAGSENCDKNVETAQETVIKCENNHAGVIICNLTLKTEQLVENEKDITGIEKVKQTIKKLESGTGPKIATKIKNKNKSRKSTIKRPYKAINIPNHITVTLEPLVYHCSICDKSFSTKAHVKYHTYCAGAVKPHKCNTCNKEFVLKAQLEVHVLKHTGSKPHVCTICQKSFTERSKLNRHLKLHSSTKPFVCCECGKELRSKASLRLHSIIHKGEKPFACKLCTAKFNNSSNLKKHLISHSIEKVHMCDQCGKRFKFKWALSVHRRSHLRIRQYECAMCSKAFVNNKDLQRHSLIHIEAKGFTCSICQTSFRRKDNLNRHMKNTHPGKKGEVIKNVISKPPIVQRDTPVDNPNAINVITASPAFYRKTEASSAKSDCRMGTVINGPIKLAFKTPAFKSNYNIHRDFDYVPPPQIKKNYDLAESVNICQKILSPHSPMSARSVSRQLDDSTSSEICQKILSPFSTPPIHYETSFQNRKHAMIKNIKFKVPIQYTINNNNNTDILPLKPVSVADNSEIVAGIDKNTTYTELKPMPSSGTSVIVTANQPSNMHWRRRTSQHLNLKS